MSNRMTRSHGRRAAGALVACLVLMVFAADELSGQERAIAVRQPVAALAVSTHARPEPNLAERCAGRPPERSNVTAAVLQAISLKDDRAARTALDDVERPVQTAAEAAPSDAAAQYDLAVVLAARSDRESGRRKITAAVQLQAQAQRVIALAPDHPGAHYLLARLYAAVKRLDRLTRFLASRMLGGGALVSPPWSDIQALFEVAERGEPCEAEYHYELAVLHREQRAHAQANTELQHVLDLTTNGDSRWIALRRQAEAWLAERTRLPQP